MRALTYLCVLTTLLACMKPGRLAPLSPATEDISLSKKLHALSKLGENFVEQEVEKALLGIKDMKKLMEKNEQRHGDILTSLRKTKEEKEEAVRLFQDISEKLSEAERQCKLRLNTQWDVCSACLERSCITFYTNSCSQQGIQEFVITAQEIFTIWPINTQAIQEVGRSDSHTDAQLSRSEGIFGQLLSDVGAAVNTSIGVFIHFKKAFDDSFQKLFLSDIYQYTPTTAPDTEPDIISDYFGHWDLSSWFQGVCEFGQTFLEAMSDIVGMMYKNLCGESQEFYIPLQEGTSHLKITSNNIECNVFQNASDCLPFRERCQLFYESILEDCPDVRDIYLKSEAAVKLVNVSTEQYEDVAQLAQRHTDEMLHLVTQMKKKYGWVTEHGNITPETGTIFTIDKVSLIPQAADQTVSETTIEATIFTTPNIIITLPPDSDLDSPEVIRYIAEKALEYYKTNF